MFITDLIERSYLIPIIEDPSALTIREERARDVWKNDALEWFSKWGEAFTTAYMSYKYIPNSKMTGLLFSITELPKGEALREAAISFLRGLQEHSLTDNAQLILCGSLLQMIRAHLYNAKRVPDSLLMLLGGLQRVS